MPCSGFLNCYLSIICIDMLNCLLYLTVIGTILLIVNTKYNLSTDNVNKSEITNKNVNMQHFEPISKKYCSILLKTCSKKYCSIKLLKT